MAQHFISSMIFAFGLAILSASSVAASPTRVFNGKIVLMEKRPPAKFSSDQAFVNFVKKHQKKDIWPKKDNPELWRLEFIAFFKKPADDLEVKVKFFDITEGKRFVAGDSVYTSSRQERILVSNMDLPKTAFEPNRKYLMYILNARNVELASTTFTLRGKTERYSGEVEFSDEDTKAQ